MQVEINNPSVLDNIGLNFTLEGFDDPQLVEEKPITLESADELEKLEEKESINLDFISKSEDKKESVKKPKTDNLESETKVSEVNLEETPEVNLGVDFNDLASKLVEAQLLEDAPEDFDSNKTLTVEDYQKLISFNLNSYKKRITELETVYDNLSDVGKLVLEYESNGGKDTTSILRSIEDLTDISVLDPNNDNDAEEIVYQWYTSQGMETSKIRSRIEKLKERGELIDEATSFKPDLDKKYASVVQTKLKTQQAKADTEKKVLSFFNDRVNKLVQTNTFKGLKLNKDQISYIQAALLTRDVEIPLPNTEKAKVTYPEAVLYKHMYGSQGSLDRLSLALLLLEKPEEFDKLYGKQIQEQEVDKFTREHKLSGLKKSGKVPETTNSKNDYSGLFRIHR